MPCRVLLPCGKTAREGARADCAFVRTHSYLFHCPQHANALPIETLRKEALKERNKFLEIPDVDEEAEAAAAEAAAAEAAAAAAAAASPAAAAAAAEAAAAAAAPPPARCSPAPEARPSTTPSSSLSATPSSSIRKRKASGGDGASASSSPSRKRRSTGGGGASAASQEPGHSTSYATPTKESRKVFNAFNSG